MVLIQERIAIFLLATMPQIPIMLVILVMIFLYIQIITLIFEMVVQMSPIVFGLFNMVV